MYLKLGFKVEVIDAVFDTDHHMRHYVHTLLIYDGSDPPQYK